jgi:hypothetical protein
MNWFSELFKSSHRKEMERYDLLIDMIKSRTELLDGQLATVEPGSPEAAEYKRAALRTVESVEAVLDERPTLGLDRRVLREATHLLTGQAHGVSAGTSSPNGAKERQHHGGPKFGLGLGPKS